MRKATSGNSWLFLFPVLYRGGLKPLGWLPIIPVQPFADVIGYYTANDGEY